MCAAMSGIFPCSLKLQQLKQISIRSSASPYFAPTLQYKHLWVHSNTAPNGQTERFDMMG